MVASGELAEEVVGSEVEVASCRDEMASLGWLVRRFVLDKARNTGLQRL